MKALAQGEPKLHCFRQKEEALLGPGQASQPHKTPAAVVLVEGKESDGRITIC